MFAREIAGTAAANELEECCAPPAQATTPVTGLPSIVPLLSPFFSPPVFT